MAFEDFKIDKSFTLFFKEIIVYYNYFLLSCQDYSYFSSYLFFSTIFLRNCYSSFSFYCSLIESVCTFVNFSPFFSKVAFVKFSYYFCCAYHCAFFSIKVSLKICTSAFFSSNSNLKVSFTSLTY